MFLLYLMNNISVAFLVKPSDEILLTLLMKNLFVWQ